MSARAAARADAAEPDLWRTLASQLSELSRFAVMQHPGVLADAGVVVIERRGRDRVNHLNPVPLREWYERWVQPMADTGAASLLALNRAAETGESVMSEPVDQIRTVRLAFELRIEASAQQTVEVMTQQSLDWFPVTCGEDRVRRMVLEPRVGGQHYEDRGDGATRGRVMPGAILDTGYGLREEAGAVVVSVSKVATGPMTDEEAAGIARFGDLTGYAPAIQKLADRRRIHPIAPAAAPPVMRVCHFSHDPPRHARRPRTRPER